MHSEHGSMNVTVTSTLHALSRHAHSYHWLILCRLMCFVTYVCRDGFATVQCKARQGIKQEPNSTITWLTGADAPSSHPFLHVCLQLRTTD